MENQQLNALFSRYLANKCSEEDISVLFQYFNTDRESELHPLVLAAMEAPDAVGSDERLQQVADSAYSIIINTIRESQVVQQNPVPVVFIRRRNIWRGVAAAASVIIILASGAFLYNSKSKQAPVTQPSVVAAAPQNLEPGGNKAILVLSNGKRINLNNAKNGELAKEDQAIIRKTADGQVIYEASAPAEQQPAAIAYNVLSTPRGGKYDLTLSDGTKVWLNAASSIRYPSVFAGSSRSVEITGEVYFEVAHDASKPFTVSVAGQKIEVLGTHFNINAYSDEPAIKTTLLEGSVRISNGTSSAVLQPGHQAVVHADQRIIINKDADVEEAMAWHEGLFKFQEADIKTVMRQLSRWYDVEVSYEGEVPKRVFSGKIYRNITALKVADVLSYKQIHFRIEGRKIIVMP
ncbi:MAG: FecR domain-containing protein [Bacteroidota bacterium]